MMMSFKDFINKYKIENKATSNRKVFQVLSVFGLENVGIYVGDGPFKSDTGIVNLHP